MPRKKKGVFKKFKSDTRRAYKYVLSKPKLPKAVKKIERGVTKFGRKVNKTKKRISKSSITGLALNYSRAINDAL